MAGHKARTVLAKTAALNWIVSIGLVIWHVIPDGNRIDDPDGTLIALFLVLAMSGTVINAIRKDRTDGPDIGAVIDTLVDTFIASRPDGDSCPTLHLVDPQGNGSTTPAPRRSVL